AGRCDIVEDVRLMNDIAMKAAPHKTGMILLGGGVAKHHICNANLMRNGADFAVYVNTAQVYGDATILLPLIISQTFAKHWERKPALPAAM
ncbi:uncharacterized protein HaLaN_27317, partial [Haematococcus lacustris]